MTPTEKRLSAHIAELQAQLGSTQRQMLDNNIRHNLLTGHDVGQGEAGICYDPNPGYGGLICLSATDNYNPEDGTGTFRFKLGQDGSVSIVDALLQIIGAGGAIAIGTTPPTGPTTGTGTWIDKDGIVVLQSNAVVARLDKQAFARVGPGDFTTTSNNPTLADVTGLSFAIGANEVWAVDTYLNGNQTSVDGMRFGFSGPTGATIQGSHLGSNGISSMQGDWWGTYLGTPTIPYINFSGGAVGYFQSHAAIINGANAGTIQFQACRGATSGTVTIYAGAYQIARRLV